MQQPGPESALPVSEYLETEPPKWPLVMGIVALLWGGMVSVSGVTGVWSMFHDRQPGVNDVATGPASVALGLLGVMMALWLMLGGVLLLRRKATAIGLLKAWVVLSLLAQAASTAFMLGNRQAFEESMREKLQAGMDEQAAKAGRTATAMPAGMERFVLVTGMACGGALAVGTAGLMGYFVFGRNGRDTEAAWRRASA